MRHRVGRVHEYVIAQEQMSRSSSLGILANEAPIVVLAQPRTAPPVDPNPPPTHQEQIVCVTGVALLLAASGVIFAWFAATL